MIGVVGKDDSKKSHATTLACVLVMCVASSVIYFLKNGRSNIGASKLILCISVNASHNYVVFIYVFKRFFYCVLNEISVCFSGQIGLPRIKN